ncbi:asparaginase domain-containing protein, partial [Weissella soli]
MKDVLVLTTGGTIASQTTENGLTPGLADDALLTYFGEVPGVTLSSEAVMSKDSTNMQPEDWLDLARRVKAYEDEYDAFIITHGTDTMGYTAAALSYLLIDVKKPVILTGSQVPVEAQGTDAVRNLNDALTYASQTELHGVFVVFD